MYPEEKWQRKEDLASVNLKKEKKRVKERVVLKGAGWPRKFLFLLALGFCPQDLQVPNIVHMSEIPERHQIGSGR